MTDIIGLGLLIVVFVSGIWYLYKNASDVPNGSSVLHYHMVSAHVNYKHKKDPE